MPRPEVSEETIQRIEELTADEFRVPDHKVSFEDRVLFLADKSEHEV